MLKQQGFAYLPITLIIIILAAIGLGGYLWVQNNPSPTYQSPGEHLNPPTTPPLPVTNPSTPSVEETAGAPSGEALLGWKTYRNEEYGFEFKYPPNASVEEIKMLPQSEILFYLKIVYGKWSDSLLLIKRKVPEQSLKDFEYTCVIPTEGYLIETSFAQDCVQPLPHWMVFNTGNIGGVRNDDQYYFLNPNVDNLLFIFQGMQQDYDKKAFEQGVETFKFIN